MNLFAHKFAAASSIAMRRDLAENHISKIARSYLQENAEAVGVAQTTEEAWGAALAREAATIALGLDGT